MIQRLETKFTAFCVFFTEELLLIKGHKDLLVLWLRSHLSPGGWREAVSDVQEPWGAETLGDVGSSHRSPETTRPTGCPEILPQSVTSAPTQPQR